MGRAVPHEAGQQPNERRTSCPWLLLAICIAGVAGVQVLRWIITGRIWGAPADPMVTDLSPASHVIGFGGMMVSYGIGLAVGVAGIVALVHARRDSRLRVAWGIVGVALLALAVVPFAGMRTVFSQGATEDIVARSQPLIAALARCEADHGEYPAALSELVPRYLPAIPSTGYGPIREFHYYRAGTRPPKGEGWDRWPNPYWEMWVGEAPYALVVLQVPRGTLVYRPTHDYRDLPGGRHLPGTLWGHTGVD